MSYPINVFYVVPAEAFVVRDVHLVAERVRAVERAEVRPTDGEEVRSQPAHRHLADVGQDYCDSGTY